MKKRTIAILSLCVLIGGGIYWQHENVGAMFRAARYTKEEIKAQIDDSKKAVESALEQYNIVGLHDYTLEEEEAIRRGELSYEEAIALRLGEGVPSYEERMDKVSKALKDEVGQKEETQKSAAYKASKESEIVASHVSRMYALKGKYIGLLGGIEGRGKQKFFALPKEQRNVKGLKSIAMPFISEAMALESQSDGEVHEVLQSLQSELQSIGADTSIVGTIKEAYNAEKGLKKAYYLSLIHR